MAPTYLPPSRPQGYGEISTSRVPPNISKGTPMAVKLKFKLEKAQSKLERATFEHEVATKSKPQQQKKCNVHKYAGALKKTVCDKC